MTRRSTGTRSGITLTEILISILIMGVGMVSLATLFPLGLARLREAQRSSRSAFLGETAVGDCGARSLFDKFSFTFSWYGQLNYDPFAFDPANPLAPIYPVANDGGVFSTAGPGLPVAYDPLWWAMVHQNSLTQGLLITPLNTQARFGSGIGFLRPDPDGGTPSAYGLQRITNFLPWVPTNLWPYTYPTITFPAGPDVAGDVFTSRDDIVMQTAQTNSTAPPAVNQVNQTGIGSPVVPDLSQSQVMNDWTYSWMFTGRQSDVNDATVFNGDVVVFHNRPLALDSETSPFGGQQAVAAGERVVEAIFGNGALPTGTPLNGRSVTLRWPTGTPDPDVRVGSWIADVTYERVEATYVSRFVNALGPNTPGALQFPGQRCIWYQVAKRNVSEADPVLPNYRHMVLTLTARVQVPTLLDNNGQPLHVNAALVSPYVVNVFPKTFYVR